jgi:hypothetical protein
LIISPPHLLAQGAFSRTVAEATDGLKISAQTLDERRDLIRVAVWRIGKLIDGGPSGTRGHAGIPREQMLMEVFTSQTDHREMDAFCAFPP